MDLFRRHQKWIFWAVTIIIVPSFVLVWGVSGSRFGRGYHDVEVARVGDTSLTLAEYHRLRKRITAANGGFPFEVSGVPSIEAAPDLWSYVCAFAALQEASAADIVAVDAEVGTYIRRIHPILSTAANGNDPKAFDKAVDSYCQSLEITREELLRGVREWLTLSGYTNLDNGTVMATDASAYVRYALDNSELFFKRLRVSETGALTENAKKEFNDKPAEERAAEIKNYIASKADDVKYRVPSEWRFEYVLVPFASATFNPDTVTAEQLEAYYESSKKTRYGDLPFDQVKARVAADYAENERTQQTRRNLDVDVDGQLKAQPTLGVDELAKLTPLAKYGVKVGVTGDAPATAAALSESPLFGAAFGIKRELDRIDALPEAERTTQIAHWKAGFRFDDNLMRTADGLIRLRLLSYEPPKSADPNGSDAAEGGRLYELAASDIVAERAREAALKRIEQVQTDINNSFAGQDSGGRTAEEIAAELDALPSEVIPYSQIPPQNFAVGRLPVGGIIDPRPYGDPATGERGQELLVLVGRKVPERKEFDELGVEVKNRYYQLARGARFGQVGIGRNYFGQYVAMFQPGEAVMQILWERIIRGDIKVIDTVFQRGSEEG